MRFVLQVGADIEADGMPAAKAAVNDEDEEEETADEGSGEPVRNGQGVLKTLKRALKTANALQGQLSFSRKADNSEQAATLFVEILNSYLFFYSESCPQITSKVGFSGLHSPHWMSAHVCPALMGRDQNTCLWVLQLLLCFLMALSGTAGYAGRRGVGCE